MIVPSCAEADPVVGGEAVTVKMRPESAVATAVNAIGVAMPETVALRFCVVAPIPSVQLALAVPSAIVVSTATVTDLRNGLPLAQVLSGSGVGAGYGTWRDVDATVPALVGLSYDAQWWIRDLGAPGGVAKSDMVRVTIEPR